MCMHITICPCTCIHVLIRTAHTMYKAASPCVHVHVYIHTPVDEGVCVDLMTVTHAGFMLSIIHVRVVV